MYQGGNKGFTLVELIGVMVILAILAAVGSKFVVSTVDSYAGVEQRTKLISRGRVVLEQITRQLRVALPNATRTSAGGNCIEFMPLVAGPTYLEQVPDVVNGMSDTSTIETAPFSLNGGSAEHAVIGGLQASEIYGTGRPLARADVSAINNTGAAPSVTLASNHRFLRNSARQRLFLGASPKRFCLIGSELYLYSDYGFVTSSVNDLDPGGQVSLMAEGVTTTSQAFTVSLGTEDVNTLIYIDLLFERNGSRVALQQEVHVRNVP